MNVLFSVIQFLQKMYAYIFRIFSKKVRILLFAEDAFMEEHIIDFINVIEDEDYNLFFYPRYDLSDKMLDFIHQYHLKVIKNNIVMQFIPWNLIVCPDKRPHFQVCAPYIYINHGTHTVGRSEGEETYAYKDLGVTRAGKVIFSTIFEPNKRIAEYILSNNPKYKDKVVWTGWKFAEQLDEEKNNYDKYRKQLSISTDEVAVFIISTWGKNSIFHTLGENLLDNVCKLNGHGYRFILSAHPREYTNYDTSIEPIGKKIDVLKNKGILVRSPKESWMNYLVASDIVISDFSTLTEMAIMLGKKVIFSEFPDNAIWKQSVIAKAKSISIPLKSGDELEERLNSTVIDQISDELINLGKETYIKRSNYESIVLREVNKYVKNRG